MVRDTLKKVLNVAARKVDRTAVIQGSDTHFSPEVLGISNDIRSEYHSVPVDVGSEGEKRPKYIAKREDKLLPKSWAILVWDSAKKEYIQNKDSHNPDGKRMYSTYEMFERMNALENKQISDLKMDMPATLPEEHFAHGYAVYGPARKSKLAKIGGAEQKARENADPNNAGRDPHRLRKEKLANQARKAAKKRNKAKKKSAPKQGGS